LSPDPAETEEKRIYTGKGHPWASVIDYRRLTGKPLLRQPSVASLLRWCFSAKEKVMKNPFSSTIKGSKGSMRAFGGIFRSKYIELILAVGLFILLDSGVLILNFYTSYQIANDAHAIQLASRMGTLSQGLLHELYQVQDDADNPSGSYSESIDIFAKSYKLFDETLDAFKVQGEIPGRPVY
jgi:hypothetical protein